MVTSSLKSRVRNALEETAVKLPLRDLILEGFDKTADHLIGLGIDTERKWAVFLGNLSHESGSFSKVEESLYYSAKRLRQVWPSRFKTASSARRVAKNPPALANHVYNGRMGNRPGSNDGWAYRGRGLIQLTGRSNYLKFGNMTYTNLLEDPDLLACSGSVMWLTAGYFFCNTKFRKVPLVDLAEQGKDKMVCRGINGGTHGLMDRIAQTKLFMDQFQVKSSNMLLKRGARNASVRELQRLLKACGYKVYKADGIFGKGTERAVKAFQSDSHIMPDGIVGKYTWSFLRLKAGMQK